MTTHLRTTQEGNIRRVVIFGRPGVLATFATDDPIQNDIAASAFRMGWAAAMNEIAKQIQKAL